MCVIAFLNLKRHTLFLAGKQPDLATPPPEPDDIIPMFATGTFQAEGPELVQWRIRGYFVSEPAVLGRVQISEAATGLGVIAHIDAIEHEGVWTQHIADGSLTDIVAGEQYFGWGRRPAVRYRYLDPRVQTSLHGILSFDRKVDRDHVFLKLRRKQAAVSPEVAA